MPRRQLGTAVPRSALLRPVPGWEKAAQSMPAVVRRPGTQPLYLALEGGGVRGIAHIGVAAALSDLADQYQTIAYVGTSAGADASAFLAPGISPDAAEHAIENFPFAKVLSGGGIDGIPVLGQMAEAGRLVHEGGLHDGGPLQKALNANLERYSGVESFADLYERIKAGAPGAARLFITASDPGHQQLAVFPLSYSDLYGITDPRDQSIPFAARASSSIPGYFAPALLKDAAGKVWPLGDGGVAALFPYEEAGELAKRFDPDARVVGVALGDVEPPQPVDLSGPAGGLSYLWSIVHTFASQWRNTLLAQKAVRKNTIIVDTGGISSVDPNLTKEQQAFLYSSGVASTYDFALGDPAAKLTAANIALMTARLETARKAVTAITPGDKSKLQADTLARLAQKIDDVSTRLHARTPVVPAPAPVSL